MLTNKFNSDLISAASRVLTGQTTERKALPQSLKDAAISAAQKLRVLNEGVQSAESRRDTLRAFFAEGVKGCGCTPSTELVNDFQTEVEDILSGKLKVVEEGNTWYDLTGPLTKNIADQMLDDLESAYKKVGLNGMYKVPGGDSGPFWEFIESLPDFLRTDPKNMVAYVLSGVKKFLKPQDAANPKIKKVFEQVEAEAEGEITEAMSKKQLEKAVNDAYRKYFDRVQVDIFDIGKISNAIEAAIKAGTDLDKVVPDLVKKYRKN